MNPAPQLASAVSVPEWAAGTPSDALKRPSAGWFACLLIGLLLVGCFIDVFHMFDFRVFYDAGARLVHGQGLYPTRAQLDARTRNYYVYPPLLAWVCAPLSQLPFVLASAIYTTAMVAMLGAALWVVGVRDIRCFIVLGLWMPVLQAVGLGTVEPALVLSLALAWRYRDRAWLGTVPLAIGIAAKLLIWPALLWLLLTGRPRRFAEAVTATAVAVFLPWAAIGFRGVEWYPHMLGLLVRTEQPSSWSIPFSGLLTPASLAADAIAAIVVAVAARSADGDRRAFSAAALAALVLSPLAWLHYLVVLIVPVALASRRFSWLWVLPVLAWWPYTDSHELLAVKLWVAAIVLLVGFVTLRGPAPVTWKLMRAPLAAPPPADAAATER